MTRSEGFEPFPKLWYDYSNILKQVQKQEALGSFIPHLIEYFRDRMGGWNGITSDILPPSTIRDISILEKKSPFDKLKGEISKLLGNSTAGSSDVESISFGNLIFLFRFLTVSNKKEDIDEILSCNNALLSDEQTLEEMFALLKSMREDDDFLLHFNDFITFFQQCGLNKGEYECYNYDNNFVYENEETEWNGFFYNNYKKREVFDFNSIPFSYRNDGYSILTYLNLLHWLFYYFSKASNCPSLLNFVDRWQLDAFIFVIASIILNKVVWEKYNLTSEVVVVVCIFWGIINFFLCFSLLYKIIVFCSKCGAVRANILYPFVFILSISAIYSHVVSLFKWMKNHLNSSADVLSFFAFSGLIGFYAFFYYNFLSRVPQVYFSILSRILFSKDILRIRRYLGNLRRFYLTIRDKNANIKSLFLKYCPISSAIFNVDISKNTLLNSEQKELFEFLYYDKEFCEDNLLRFYSLFYKYRNIFLKSIIETQYVGSYVIAAVLVSSGKFCLPQFKYSGENYIRMKDVVHPGIIDRCVKNSFEIGEKETGIRNMLFSGSNGTGKTTFQFAVVDNVILAQSLGIACCSEYSATVFDKIISMSNAKTDLSEGLSGYTSEVEMVKACLLYLWGNKDKRILLISDEPLSTTDPVFADKLVERICRCLFSFPNVTSIVSTHFNSPRDIERKYENLHVGNFRFKLVDEGTSIKNLYILERGCGHNIGKTIAEQRGLIDLFQMLGC